MSTLYNNISHIITKVRGKICVISKHSERKKKTTSQSSVFFYFPNSTLGAGYWTLTRKRVLDITNLAPQWFYWWNALSCMSFCPSANSFLDVDGDLKPSTLQDCFAGPNSNGTQDLITFIQKKINVNIPLKLILQLLNVLMLLLEILFADRWRLFSTAIRIVRIHHNADKRRASIGGVHRCI